MNRLTNGTSDEGFNETINYDKMGNIVSLSRNPMGTNTYSYNGNRLTGISGAINSSYTYDINGNQTGDSHKGVTLAYNYLNLPETISKASTSETMTNTWLATGAKIRKTVGGLTREYVGGIEYNDGIIEFIQTEEGRAILNGSSGYRYEYMLKDHLGNTRVLLDENGTVLENSDYYPFGLQVARGQTVISPENRYKYNSKELQTELGLGQYDYGARFYDPAAGRWNVVDPLAEKYPSISPYAYVTNNPIMFIDPDGRDIIPVHGTWSNIKTWGNLGGITKASNNLFKDNRLGASYGWSGDNFSGARTKAAIGLIDHVRTQMKSEGFNGSITLVGHSHGGNVSIEALNMMAETKEFDNVEFNLLTINTPVRDDYQLSEEASGRVNHVNIYDEMDPVQSKGGDGFLNKLFGGYAAGTRTGKTIGQQKGSGEVGDAGRKFDNAENISVDKPQNALGDFHNSHNRTNDWIDKTED